MGDAAIRFEGVSKKYRLRRRWYRSIRDETERLALMLRRRPSPREEVWALRDVSFEVGRRETIGLIGSNGAGKSTILKILSRVTVPTTGRFAVQGKVGALIELGAAFHPDLTGRENVYLNGAIMGMRRAEVRAKFDRIVTFAELDRYVDTPMKYYSSGMTVRLGFAVAAHVDPEILLVDEVLAVGDAAFQAKCLDKLAELKERGGTVILVSHNMASILRHSTQVLWVERGRVRGFGEPERVVDEYLRSAQERIAAAAPPPAATGDGPIRIREVVIRDARGVAGTVLEYDRPATVEVAYEVVSPVADPVVGVGFHDSRGYPLGGLTTRLDGVKVDGSSGGVVRLVLAPVLFTRGSYTVTAAIYDGRIQRYLAFRSKAASFVVEGPSVSSREVDGHVVYPHRWTVEATRP
jgi:ABC-2 type transport system ATP-binding protein